MDWRARDAVCAAVFEGQVELGGACHVGEECRSGSCLVRNCNPRSCCTGACVAPQLVFAEIGEPCADGCVEGAYCGAGGTCVPLEPAGGRCQSDYVCGYGLRCDEGTCADTPGRGEPCTDGTCENAFGDRCDLTSATCVRLSPAAGRCLGDYDCQRPLQCGSTGRCEHAPRIGQACIGECAPGGFCLQGTCEAYAQGSDDGETCDLDRKCKSHFCDVPFVGATGVCRSGPCDRPMSPIEGE